MTQPKIKSIAIIGSGVAGLTAAHLLHQNYDITLYEANNYLGGHTHTIDVKLDHGDYAIDTGFIVFNTRTYPNFIKLLEQLGVNKQASDMSFSISTDTKPFLEYSGASLNSLFAQRKNSVNPKFYRLLYDIWRFNRLAQQFLQQGSNSTSILLTLSDFIEQHRFSDYFVHYYFYPLASAIWSTPISLVASMPAYFVLRFYAHHGLLSFTGHPQWYVIPGGSKNYIAPLIKPFTDKIRLNSPVLGIDRHTDHVLIRTAAGTQTVDAVVLACHSDQALNLLTHPSASEVEILTQLPYVANTAILHTDATVLPNNHRAWASWNYRCVSNTGQATLTYYMNQLQSIKAPVPFCVSINTPTVDSDKIIGTYSYAHPLFQQQSMTAQARHHEINAKQRTYYAGAYWGNGFHEDGVVSSLNALASLGVHL